MTRAGGPRPAVVAVTGHMVDAPDRAEARFPPGQLPRVTEEIKGALAEWDVGPGTTIVCGGARGADIIVAEEGLARGAQVILCLALPEDEFDRRSVALPATDWSERFRRLLGVAEVRHLADEVSVVPSGDEVFARVNEWMVRTARALAGASPHAVIVWNGKEGDGPGGTRHFVRELGFEGPDRRVAVIDPTPRAYEARQKPGEPKKLLALDGGGIRGVLTLEVLYELEVCLRRRLGDGLVLADYFDYVAGTSTGAIIAAGLAAGLEVAELRQHYETLADNVFRKRLPFARLRSFYPGGRLYKALEDVFDQQTLGDPKLRSLLSIVLHNTVTDSAWPLSNCTRAKYNRADRNLLDPPDRNLDVLLTTLLRGSTAAPFYFPPQGVTVGKHLFVFQDGGITPFNNPAFMLFLQATLPEYGLGWPAEEDGLLLVSVGTGATAAVHPSLRSGGVNLLFNARNVPAVLLNGASVGQDVLCRSFGHCRAGPKIDSEMGDRVGAGGVGGRSLFTYVRYNADLSDGALRGRYCARRRRRLRKLDALKAVPDLQALGREVAAKIDLDRHFGGFLGA